MHYLKQPKAGEQYRLVAKLILENAYNRVNGRQADAVTVGCLTGGLLKSTLALSDNVMFGAYDKEESI